ncbi:class I SAM-dependent methyltransferase [Nocardioides pantholopis]|uniref:class I SAM-dependent methyltransferase n=1 Tax=Nocardioides pantholopis TaxID=2483798 RepID=UPI000FDC7E73|nr:class I SAM-dependent methyltransferase [Nocardioides pantholopis]
MSGTHFERMAAEYARARPPYPPPLYEALSEVGVIGPGRRVLEVGAGAGLATRELARRGCAVVALEPGPELASLARRSVPDATVIEQRLEDADLPEHSFDSAVAATSLHWVDLTVGLPALHAALRPGGWLGVWRTIFGPEDVVTDFRVRVGEIVARRDPAGAGAPRPPERPTMEELAAGGWFEPVHTERWRWTIDLDTDQVRSLFRSFSDWTPAEAEEAARAVDELGGQVTEHYRSVLHLLRRTPSSDG